ncbi:hypothetical protein A3G67_00655 [Candidatus Roizmanbacteria bacterium RIFCSPLOWO2_12_FULL_40_12]|uniref:Uncharacterized protein n=1 Tax=Candidatus Roizmanbacteria bacterium RIFCSPLOWO2_01_FULL_40_42 TaxID=1802066 RepID=A0A1F7J683_9BACT|nr:MAG: hypothetical protein A2779_02135 [Candidatus Roizmanbacteria bacterium RIFCSPHIGHO2_01_FULL_40_98]OGK28789.1 MAG: hypothetical protein A3C31_04055 [Candidatus Roizmanbacteria bacterium RIFCSPHIGHO2_02_FULL_40_53]OGK29647.1 MAG: hypothetical protein A2W49_00450 [Candidatus Roizmanbacteria bacterium RIFCSPHIGHO2_12_41_18]OGK36318.1 MAG: hypothetical protein A3E69_02730 [Candidatus Roizmanbacteria bacterium RIFCSPHIGHO2_12_FULL_40_130]OGK51130.1 MAG: hypothetical protein A3B50_05030 [Candi
MNEGMERPKPRPKQTPDMSRRDFLIKGGSVGAGIALGKPLGVFDAVFGKDKKPKGKNGNEEAQGVTSTTKAEIKEMNSEISAVAKNIDATLRMTPEEFTEWVNTEHEDGTTNALWYGQTVPFGFPHVQNFADGGFSTRLTYIDNEGTAFTYAHIPGRVFPRVPHMSLAQWNPETPSYLGMLSFFNGSVTIPLESEDAGSATVSFGTQIWPDGTKVPFGWISNLDVPNNPLFGPNQSLLTDQPQPLYTAHKNNVNDNLHRGKTMTREELLEELETNIGKPIETYLNTDQAMKTALFFDEYGSVGSIDVHIEGLDLFQQYPTYRAMIDGFFNQDSVGFQAAVEQGIQNGFFLNADTASPKQVVKTLKTTLTNIKTVQDLFGRFPWGRPTFITDAIAPKPLVQK